MPLPLGQGPAPSPAAQVLGELPLPATRHPPHLPRRSPPPPLPLPMVLEHGGLCRPFCPGERCPWPVLAWSPVAGPGTRTRGRGFGRVTPGRAARRRPRCQVASWHEVCCQACRWRRRASRGVRGVPPGCSPAGARVRGSQPPSREVPTPPRVRAACLRAPAGLGRALGVRGATGTAVVVALPGRGESVRACRTVPHGHSCNGRWPRPSVHPPHSSLKPRLLHEALPGPWPGADTPPGPPACPLHHNCLPVPPALAGNSF